jgi:hypothetical protein
MAASVSLSAAACDSPSANERRKKAVAASGLLYVIEHFHVYLPAILQ